MNKLLIMTCAAAVTASANSATLTLTTSDASGKSSFDVWDVSGGGADAPSAGNDYVVSGGKYIRVIWNRTFGGNTLSFGKGNSSGALVIQRGNADVGHTIGFGNNGAILENGYWTMWASGRTPTISNAGSLTVTAPESRPFRIALGDGNNTNNAMTINAPIKGAAGTALLLCSGTKPMLPSFYLYNLSADYKGKLIIGGGEEKSGRNSFPVYADIAGALGGSLVVQTNAMVALRYTTTTFTVPSLELQSGSILVARNKVNENGCGKIVVTDSLTVEPGAIVKLNTHPYNGSGYDGYDWVVLTLPATKGTIPLENFVCSDVDGVPPCSLVTNLVDGVWQLTIHKEPHDVLMANDSTDTTISKALPSALTNATSWSSGNEPQPGKTYIAVAGAGGLDSSTYPRIRTPYQSEPFVFAGDALVLGAGGAIYPCGKDVTFPLLNLSPNTTYINALANCPSHLRGKVYLRTADDTYPQRFQAYMKGLSAVDAEVSGAGTLYVMSRSSSGNPYGDFELTALNTNFTGRIKVYAENTSDANKIPSAADYRHERIFVTDARNLGGPLAEFDADSLELTDYSVLEVRNDVDLNVANRGITITGNGCFAVPENVTLAVSNDLTYNGVLTKKGAGILALNGSARAGSGAALAVSEGYVRVGATNVLNGVSVTFADGAYLLVDPTATGDVAAFGAVDLSATPFGGTLPVAFVLPTLGNGQTYSYSDVAVCTVADSATAEALTITAKKVAKHSVKFSTRTNADGSVTVLAKISPKGFILSVM